MGTDDDRWRHATLPAEPVPETGVPTVDQNVPGPSARGSETPRAARGPFDPPRHDRFEERAEIGRGGMGRVFEARDTALDRPVAIKQSLTDNAVDLARFEREARITAQLQHPGIVPVLDAGRDETGRPYYVMRKIEGRPLADMIDDAKTVPQRIALVPRILGAVDAIAYAHARGVIHRDLKSWNVLLGPFGETLVIDWGLARELADPEDPGPSGASEPGDGSLTRAGTAYGTPGFMPPEQARGEMLDRRADVYALGAMLLHALQGVPPLAKLAPDAAIAVAAAATMPDLSAISDQVPAELTAIVGKAMAPRAAERYPDASALAEDLRRFTTGQLVAAHSYSPGELIARWVRRHRLAVTIGAIALVVLAVFGVLAIRRVIDERDRADAARLAEETRADELLVERADAIVADDPTRALALLKQLREGSPATSRAMAVYDSAVARGVARGRLAHRNVRVAAIAAAPTGDLVASVADDGAVLVHDPALREPVKRLATLNEPSQVAWFGRAVIAIQADGGMFQIDLDGKVTKLDGGGPVSSMRATPRRLIAQGQDHMLREIDPRGGPPVPIAAASIFETVGDGLLYVTTSSIVFHRFGSAPLFLDEIGELPADLQPKLLRALESREIRRVGSRTTIHCDLRIVAATNRDLRAEVNRGTFRADLYYRLAVVKLALPPLRDRTGDFPLLVGHLLGRIGADAATTAKLTAPEFVAQLAVAPWPGNVRELRNHLEQCVVFGEQRTPQSPAVPHPSSTIDPSLPYEVARRQAIDAFERDYVTALLAKSGDNVAQAARDAGVNRAYLHRLLRRHGLR